MTPRTLENLDGATYGGLTRELRALKAQGKSLSQMVAALDERFQVKVTKRTVANWLTALED